MFEIEKTNSFNTDLLTIGNDYDYVTRTSCNQGILQSTGFVNKLNINKANTWSLGLLQMDFFFRKRAWYAGQFVRKITPKFDLTYGNIHFFTAVLNNQKQKLLSVLVRDIDETFNNLTVLLPTKNNAIDFDFMESYIEQIKAEKERKLSDYLLKIGGGYSCCLTDEDRAVLSEKKAFKSFNIDAENNGIFTVINTHSILKDMLKAKGVYPYVTASENNNSIMGYYDFDKSLVEKGNCISIGGKTMVVTYQPNDYISNDSHNLALYYLDDKPVNSKVYLYTVAAIRKSLSYKYSWGNSISKRKIKNDAVDLPITSDGSIDFDYMEKYITAIEKIVAGRLKK